MAAEKSNDRPEEVIQSEIANSETIAPKWVTCRTYIVKSDWAYYRTAPSKNATAVGKFYKNNTVLVKEISSANWAKIKVNGKWYYIYAKHLRKA